MTGGGARTVGFRIAVIADVHGNALAYRAALALVRDRGFDRLIVLGDLLTYGCEPLAVLELTHEAVARDGALLIRGNHESLYADLARGDRSYYAGLPDWLRETVDWTAAAVGEGDPTATFAWLDEHEAEGIVFAHANPFGPDDRTYLNAPADLVRAARALRERGRTIGVFGHTHRPTIVEVAADGACRSTVPGDDGVGRVTIAADRPEGAAVVANAGSVGQPRDRARVSTVLFLSGAPGAGGAVALDHAPVVYDVGAHKRTIAAASLSAATQAKLTGFFP